MTDKCEMPLWEGAEQESPTDIIRQPTHTHSHFHTQSSSSQSNKELIVLSLAVILSLTRQAPWDELAATNIGTGHLQTTSSLAPDLADFDFRQSAIFKGPISPSSGYHSDVSSDSGLFTQLYDLGKTSRIADWLAKNGNELHKPKVYPTIVATNSSPLLWNDEDTVALSFYQESSKDILSVLPKPESLSSGSESPMNIDNMDFFVEEEPWDSLDPDFLGFLINDNDDEAEINRISSLVQHNHSYASSECSESKISKLDMRASMLRNRDPRRLAEAGLRVSYNQLIECTNQEFLQLLREHNHDQQAIMIAVRKRGKNRLAAATCRARKERHCARVKSDVGNVSEKLTSLRSQLDSASVLEADLRDKYMQLYLGVLSRIKGRDGQKVDPRFLHLQHRDSEIELKRRSRGADCE